MIVSTLAELRARCLPDISVDEAQSIANDLATLTRSVYLALDAIREVEASLRRVDPWGRCPRCQRRVPEDEYVDDESACVDCVDEDDVFAIRGERFASRREQ